MNDIRKPDRYYDKVRLATYVRPPVFLTVKEIRAKYFVSTSQTVAAIIDMAEQMWNPALRFFLENEAKRRGLHTIMDAAVDIIRDQSKKHGGIL